MFYIPLHYLDMACQAGYYLMVSNVLTGNIKNQRSGAYSKMTSEEMQILLSKSNNAIVGVNRAEGGPQLTPVWYAWDGAAFYFSTTKDRVKYANIKRDPDITLIVDDFDMHKYVVAYGRAEIIEHNYGDLLRPVVSKYVPPDQVERSIKAVTDNPMRVLVVLRPDKIVTN